jgi:hypothetical protein
MKKHFEVVGRGVAVVVGCGTFPTWNTYPGLFAALATGNAVIVKPHATPSCPPPSPCAPSAPFWLRTASTPIWSRCVPDKRETTQALVTHPAVKSVDFTGGNVFGQWLIEHCRQAQVYAELAGVNNIVIDSTDAYKPMLRNLAFTCRCIPARCAPPRRRCLCRPVALTPKTATRLMTMSAPTWRAQWKASWPNPKSPAPCSALSSPPTRWPHRAGRQRQAGQGLAGLQKARQPGIPQGRSAHPGAAGVRRK